VVLLVLKVKKVKLVLKEIPVGLEKLDQLAQLELLAQVVLLVLKVKKVKLVLKVTLEIQVHLQLLEWEPLVLVHKELLPLQIQEML
jgi:hypothetical protein